MAIQSFNMNDKDFQTIRKKVYDSIGVNLTDAKRNLVVSRLSRRLRELKLDSFGSYLSYLEGNAQELEILFNRITTGVTKFFRENHHFEFLVEEFLPGYEENLKKTGGEFQFRGWSAGCSTGEEPYTLAMVLHHYLSTRKKRGSIEILASDINTEVLQKARRGIYKKKEVLDIPYDFLKRYFQLGTGQNEGLLKVKNEISDLISFRQVNLTATHQFPLAKPLTVIFCRNVFIYFNRETQTRLLDAFHQHLIPGGILFLGHSESIPYQSGTTGPLKWRLIRQTIYEKNL